VARTSMMAKLVKKPKFKIRFRKFQMCRLCFRQLALKGEIPGVTKSSW